MSHVTNIHFSNGRRLTFRRDGAAVRSIESGMTAQPHSSIATADVEVDGLQDAFRRVIDGLRGEEVALRGRQEVRITTIADDATLVIAYVDGVVDSVSTLDADGLERTALGVPEIEDDHSLLFSLLADLLGRGTLLGV